MILFLNKNFSSNFSSIHVLQTPAFGISMYQYKKQNQHKFTFKSIWINNSLIWIFVFDLFQHRIQLVYIKWWLIVWSVSKPPIWFWKTKIKMLWSETVMQRQELSGYDVTKANCKCKKLSRQFLRLKRMSCCKAFPYAIDWESRRYIWSTDLDSWKQKDF